jgi:Phosphate-selective porin O and P
MLAIVAGALAPARLAQAQVTPAAGYVPPDDTPVIRVGATIFGDYTVTTQPKVTDADGNLVTGNAFNIARAYINVTGNISHRIAFRITPDIVRETTTGSALNGSLTYRLKYAYGQFNLDDWMTRGSWVRFGIQQTPWVDFMEGVYRYRFQGTIFEEREGFVSSSDAGASFHYNFTKNYGEMHFGLYNGENYNRAEANDQKGFMVRGTVRPLPMGSPAIRGLRVTGFYDADHYLKNGDRTRGIFGLTYEHQYANASFDYLWASDQTRTINPKLDSDGFSFWITPKTTKGWEGLLRFDHLNRDTSPTVKGKTDRTIAGVSYWFPHQGTVSTVLLLDFERVKNKDYTPVRPNEQRWALHMLVNF